MWPNGFNSGSPFQNDFNQGNFPQMPYGGSPGAFFPLPGMMQFNQMEEDDTMDGGYQSDNAHVNNSAFMQNQNINAQFTPSPFMNPPMAPAAQTPNLVPVSTTMGARAAELKAELLKKLSARTNSATPPVPKSSVEVDEMKKASATIPKTTDEEHEQDLNDLISEYSAPKAYTGTINKLEKQHNTTNTEKTAAGNVTSTQARKQSGKGGQPATNGSSQPDQAKSKAKTSRAVSHCSMSEGEIVEDINPTKTKTMTPPQPKTKQSKPKAVPPEEPARTPMNRSEENVKQSHSHPKEESRRRTPPPVYKGHLPSSHNERGAVSRSNSDHRAHANGDRVRNTVEQQVPHSEPRKEQIQTPQPIATPARLDSSRRPSEANGLSLADVLPLDRDLREWLDITGYHNEEYRSKILNRRRAIAELDAKREQMLAEMEAEERGGAPPRAPPSIVQPQASSMLPPPIINTVGARTKNPVVSTIVPTAIQPQNERISSNKRPYTEYRESEESIKVEDRRNAPRPRSEEADRWSRGYDSTRRRDDEDAPRPRFEARPRSPIRDLSPARRYEGRPRERGYDMDNFYDDRDDMYDHGTPRTRGSYRGKPFNSDYTANRGGRGRGRGRGETRDQRDHDESPFGSKIANGKTYRDSNGFKRGGHGDTRYFIVKSFNEENVLKCIEDSVWTTQIQNGDIFREAFETCKNVILVFSINKSRAFQGYARMESLPGSVPVPNWQKSINWESAGAFKVKWLVICSTRFHRVGHLKNPYNENQAVLIGKDGQEIEEKCGAGLIELIDEEADLALGPVRIKSEERYWDTRY